MSRTLFATMFVESTGETPARYLTRLRMERARDLLQRSQLSLAMVAHRMGYGTDVEFARAFKRQFGISPGRCRAGAHHSMAQSPHGRNPAAGQPEFPVGFHRYGTKRHIAVPPEV